MMNHVKSALLSGHRVPHHLAAAAQHQLAAAASFHSTPPLQRKRKTQWHHAVLFISIFIVTGMKMTKMMNQVDLLGSEDIGGSGIQRLMVSVHMIFIMGTSEARVDLSFAQVMRMNQKPSFVMLFVATRHFIGLLTLMIINGEIADILILKVPDIGVMRQMMRVKHPHRWRYHWHGGHLD